MAEVMDGNVLSLRDWGEKASAVAEAVWAYQEVLPAGREALEPVALAIVGQLVDADAFDLPLSRGYVLRRHYAVNGLDGETVEVGAYLAKFDSSLCKERLVVSDSNLDALPADALADFLTDLQGGLLEEMVASLTAGREGLNRLLAGLLG